MCQRFRLTLTISHVAIFGKLSQRALGFRVSLVSLKAPSKPVQAPMMLMVTLD